MYKEGHALCKGRDVSMNGGNKVVKNGAPIPATLRQGQGINTDFGTLWLRGWQTQCQWKKVRDITVIRLQRIHLGGSVLVDDN